MDFHETALQFGAKFSLSLSSLISVWCSCRLLRYVTNVGYETLELHLTTFGSGSSVPRGMMCRVYHLEPGPLVKYYSLAPIAGGRGCI
jgi:hypothetical protein